jgi:hypothetical protein
VIGRREQRWNNFRGDDLTSIKKSPTNWIIEG